MMDLEKAREIAGKLSKGEVERLVEELLETLLSSVNSDRVPDEVGRSLATAVKEKRWTEDTLAKLLYAVHLSEPEKLENILRNSGLEEA